MYRCALLAISLLLTSLLLACSGGGGASSADISSGADVAGDSDVSSASEIVGDSDVSGSIDVAASCVPSVPVDEPDASQSKFALAMFHFNLQYVAGGLEYVDDDGVTREMISGTTEGWDNDAVEDWIITETFAPVISFYLDHPEWKVNIELQGYMLDVIAARHPALLEDLRTVTARGQVELMSFHYSDQFFLAFPREDLRRSIAATKAVFERLCLPLSPVVFDQEGQAGEGRQAMLVDEGYGIGVYPKNLWRYQYSDAPRWPYYKSKGGDLIVGPGEVDPDSGVEVEWLFFDDGEVLAPTSGIDPYFAPVASYDPARMADYEAKIRDAEARGFRISHVSDYVRHLKARGVEQPDAPPLLDGTWQPQSTDSVHRWLGAGGEVWWKDEQDNAVRTGNAQAHRELVLAETLLDDAEAEGVDIAAWREPLAAAWRDLWLAEVSDATGINPWAAEVFYGLQHNRLAREAAATVIEEAKAALGAPWVWIDSQTGEVTILDELPMPEPPPPIEPTLTLVTNPNGREVRETWSQMRTVPDIAEVHVTFGPSDGDVNDRATHTIALAVPRTIDRIRYSPALLDDQLSDLPFDTFTWDAGELWLPLANGLIGLGEDLWLIKDTRAMHLAARLAPDDPYVRFSDETAPADASQTWTFLILRGTAEEALSVANSRNIWPADYR